MCIFFPSMSLARSPPFLPSLSLPEACIWLGVVVTFNATFLVSYFETGVTGEQNAWLGSLFGRKEGGKEYFRVSIWMGMGIGYGIGGLVGRGTGMIEIRVGVRWKMDSGMEEEFGNLGDWSGTYMSTCFLFVGIWCESWSWNTFF
ncbi:hypothetical protein GQ44DRAFT_285201 [Phaeosphaeriaceae sp. PMI808]|nr:hypothetical protein GQ44DRAFT_285201 [Phaeosphaeriaceae sp. PMI808]